MKPKKKSRGKPLTSDTEVGKATRFERGNELGKLGDRGRRARFLTQQLISAITMWDEKQGRRNFEIMMDNVVERAKNGDQQAVDFIMERIEGKVPQSVSGTITHQTLDPSKLTDDELQTLIFLNRKARVIEGEAIEIFPGVPMIPSENDKK